MYNAISVILIIVGIFFMFRSKCFGYGLIISGLLLGLTGSIQGGAEINELFAKYNGDDLWEKYQKEQNRKK